MTAQLRLDESVIESRIQSGTQKAFNFADADVYEWADADTVCSKLEELASEVMKDGHILYILRNKIEPSDSKSIYDFGMDLYFEIQGHGVGFWDGGWDDVLSEDNIEYLGEWTGDYSLTF
jgi:hypothetical protein